MDPSTMAFINALSILAAALLSSYMTHRLDGWRLTQLEKHFNNGIYSEIKSIKSEVSDVKTEQRLMKKDIDHIADMVDSRKTDHGRNGDDRRGQ